MTGSRSRQAHDGLGSPVSRWGCSGAHGPARRLTDRWAVGHPPGVARSAALPTRQLCRYGRSCHGVVSGQHIADTRAASGGPLVDLARQEVRTWAVTG